jgi:hypothetical protein
MILSIFLISLITAGGFALTYLIADDEPLSWRIAAGCVIGCAFFGTVGLAIASVAGLSVVIAIVMFLLVLSPLLLLRNSRISRLLAGDRNRARQRFEGKSLRRVMPFVYYVGFILLFLFFFERAMFVREGAIMTGGSNNLGDLPFHLGAIFSFTEANNFPPANPNFAGAKFTYPFIADLLTAYFVKLGADVKDAMLVQNVAWATSLLVLLQRFVFKLVNDRVAARIAPFLLFLSGGLGFIWFFGDFGAQAKGFWEFLAALPKDYTIGSDFRWGNSLTTLFITQRSLLLGMPITLIVLGVLWNIFKERDQETNVSAGTVKFSHVTLSPALVVTGLLAGTLVLIHLHSLFVLFTVTACLMALSPVRIKLIQYLVFGVSVAIVALPELAWSLSGSVSEASEFVSRHFGWDSGENNILWFWVKNTGLFIPIAAAGLFLTWRIASRPADPDMTPEVKGKKKQNPLARKTTDAVPRFPTSLLLFYVPFLLLFVLSNLFKFAPWEWDNIKLLIYWWVGSIPFVAYAIAYVWRLNGAGIAAALMLIVLLTAAGTLDVYRVVTKQVNWTVFERDAVEIGNEIRLRTSPDAVILNAPTYNTAVVLSGRASFMRYPGHLLSHGINYGERQSAAKTIYSGGPAADTMMTQHGIDFVLFGPEVDSFAQDPSGRFTPNEAHFKKYKVLVATDKYRIYKVNEQ